LASSITGTSVTRAGGGGGSVNNFGQAGGSGGGGAGENGATPAGNGAVNTGSGGGTIFAIGGVGFGGSGVVIIAYSQAFDQAAATTGSPTYSGVSRSGFHVYTFTGSGSITF
jgi:hypothetical protein